MKKNIFTSVVLLFLSACSPKVGAIVIQNKDPLPEYASVAVLEDTGWPPGFNPEKLGSVSVGDKGLTLECGYEFMLALAREQARGLGGNVLLITDHKLPGTWSSCHRIRADVFFAEDVTPFEKRITWHEKRPLRLADFKGATEDRPFLAATVGYLQVSSAIRPGIPPQLSIRVETVFDCQKSYFNDQNSPGETLEHEQIHFDISEWFARQLRKKYREEISNLKSWNANAQPFLDEINGALILMQDKYDSEVYADRTKQVFWKMKVKAALEQWKDYSSQEVVVRKK